MTNDAQLEGEKNETEVAPVAQHPEEKKLRELEALAEQVARAYRVPESEIPVMIETARADQESAWVCFRLIAQELGLEVER